MPSPAGSPWATPAAPTCSRSSKSSEALVQPGHPAFAGVRPGGNGTRAGPSGDLKFRLSAFAFASTAGRGGPRARTPGRSSARQPTQHPHSGHRFRIHHLQRFTMPIVSMRQLLDHAAQEGYGIPAFNVNNLEQVQAVMSAADEVGAPVILQASAGARKYAGEAFVKHLIQAALETWPHIPLVMHQDHGQSPDVCRGAIDLGFSSVMMDGSLESDGKSIASYDYNIEVTRKVVDMAHKVGVTVEGELGCLGSLETMKGDKEDGHGTDATMTREQLLTDPEQAADFVKRTQLDALAIAIGTSHGAYKFTRKPTGDILAISRIKEIHKRIPNTHL